MNLAKIVKSIKSQIKFNLEHQVSAQDHLVIKPEINLVANRSAKIKQVFKQLEYSIYYDQTECTIINALQKCNNLLTTIDLAAITLASQAYQNSQQGWQKNWDFYHWYQFHLWGIEQQDQQHLKKLWTLWKQNRFWQQFYEAVRFQDQLLNLEIDSYQLCQDLIDSQLLFIDRYYQFWKTNALRPD